MPVPMRRLSSSTALLLGTLLLPLPALAQGGPTLGDIVRQAEQPAPAARPAPTPAPAPAAPQGRALTLEEIARQAAQPAAPAGGQRPAPAARTQQAPAAAGGPTLGDIVQATTPQGCDRPKAPEKFPDGRSAPEPEMRAAQEGIRKYVAEGETFNSCIDKLIRDNYARLTVSDYLTLLQQQVIMEAQVMQAANRFNEQLRLFKAKAP
ncbi:hypothetical protein HHL28_16280 [Aerophototrophica crusticola]|uniref:DUF4168 domain-containing protein n=1 Tax=Aerophototrophica crusticola TaxID=1709002 RepID=A0A858RB75_9PROT|nr:hypothetical protein HHL28_16280 [Rhodospirillaceae bacterium B3]